MLKVNLDLTCSQHPMLWRDCWRPFTFRSACPPARRRGWLNLGYTAVPPSPPQVPFGTRGHTIQLQIQLAFPTDPYWMDSGGEQSIWRSRSRIAGLGNRARAMHDEIDPSLLRIFPCLWPEGADGRWKNRQHCSVPRPSSLSLWPMFPLSTETRIVRFFPLSSTCPANLNPHSSCTFVCEALSVAWTGR